MTQPQAQENPQTPPPEALAQQTPSEARLVAALASVLAVGAAYDATVKSVLAILAPLGMSALAVRTATRIAMSAPIGDKVPSGAKSGTATVTSARLERVFRATYLVNSAKRISKHMREGGKPLEIIQRERQHFASHLEAQSRRRTVARQIDTTALRHGKTLGWYAMMDTRTSAECRWANGRNFEVDKRPPIGYPGTVHPNCRCKPGPPHAGTRTVYPSSSKRRIA